MNEAMDDSRDQLQRRCPRLGGPVTFHYCRTCGEKQTPCFKVVDCWWEFFDVAAYFQNLLPEEDFNRLLNARPKPKVSSLVELIAQARARCEK